MSNVQLMVINRDQYFRAVEVLTADFLSSRISQVGELFVTIFLNEKDVLALVNAGVFVRKAFPNER